jgi:hypothetical protein
MPRASTQLTLHVRTAVNFIYHIRFFLHAFTARRRGPIGLYALRFPSLTILAIR